MKSVESWSSDDKELEILIVCIDWLVSYYINPNPTSRQTINGIVIKYSRYNLYALAINHMCNHIFIHLSAE